MLMVGLSSPQWFSSPELPTAAWQWPPATHKWLWFVSLWLGDRGCVCVTSSTAGPSPGLKLEQGRQQCLAPAQGLNQQHSDQVLLLSLYFMLFSS